MAEFCNKCAAKKGFGVDINIDTIFEKLHPGEYQVVLCEGCGLTAIGKTAGGVLMLAIPASDVDRDPAMVAVRWVGQDEFMNL